PDAPEYDDAERLSLQFSTDEILSLPLAGFQTAIRLGNTARERNEQSDRMLCRRDRISVRRVHHYDAASRGRCNIDVVDAHTGAADHAQVLRRVHQLGSNPGDTANDQSFAIGDCGAQLISSQSGSSFDDE